MAKSKEKQSLRHYFVDEAGDPTIFDSKGRSVIGTPGCSRFFMLGYVDIKEPKIVAESLKDLRVRLLADPRFRDVPSMQPKANKTALAFHAKDDLPDVRHEVLALLQKTEGLRFYAILRDKQTLLASIQRKNREESEFRYNPNGQYDYMIQRLFQDKLHKVSACRICFARRGKAERMAALRGALQAAKSSFEKRWWIPSDSTLDIIPSRPQDTTELQVVDYFLWTLQRLYERQEEQYLNMLWPSYREVIDVDDPRLRGRGEYYTQRKPLNRAALEGRL